MIENIFLLLTKEVKIRRILKGGFVQSKGLVYECVEWEELGDIYMTNLVFVHWIGNSRGIPRHLQRSWYLIIPGKTHF